MLSDEEDLGSCSSLGVKGAGRGKKGEGVCRKKEGRKVAKGERIGGSEYSPQRSEVKAKSVLLRKWVQDGSPFFQHRHHSAFHICTHLHTVLCLTYCTV